MSTGAAHDLPTRHVNYLDGWRGLAIALLLVGHFTPVPGINFGNIGVNLFFVLSGLLMAGLLFEKKEPISTFYRRRIARIVPAQVTFILAITLTYVLLGLPFSFRETLSALFFLNNYIFPANGPGTALMPFGHIWSLSVEEHSYIALSLIAFASRRKYVSAATGTGVLLILSVLFAAWYQYLNPPQLAFAQWLHTEVAAYPLLGTAWWVASGRPINRRLQSPWMPPALVLVGIALQWWSIPLLAQKLLGVTCFIAALCLLTVTEGWFARLLAWAPLRQLGLWSYSLYLWQQPFYLWTNQDKRLPPLVALALALGCGLVFFYLVERPARAWLNAHWGTRQADVWQAGPSAQRSRD